MTPVVWISGISLVMLIALVAVTVGVVVALTRRARRPGDTREPLTAASAARTHARRIHVAAWCALVLAMVTMTAVASSARQ